MTRSPSLVLVNTPASGLSKEQKTFNRLIAKIDKLRKQLADWKEVIPKVQQKCAAELLPMLDRYEELRADMLRLLDQAFSSKKFTKNERAKLSDQICGLASDLLMGEQKEEYKEIYNRHGGDFDAEAEAGENEIREMFNKMFGIELEGDIDLTSPEKMMAQVAEQLEKVGQMPTQESPVPPRKKTAKQLSKEQKQQEEQQSASKSLREVYRKLASDLHPDREPDSAERDCKTVLMQRVNAAYEKKDLLALLELQLEIEQIDQNRIGAISSEKLKHFNAVLKEQVQELEQEIYAIEAGFCAKLNLPMVRKIMPQIALKEVEMACYTAQCDIDNLKRDLASFEDEKNIKEWLKTCQIQNFENDFAFL